MRWLFPFLAFSVVGCGGSVTTLGDVDGGGTTPPQDGSTTTTPPRDSAVTVNGDGDWVPFDATVVVRVPVNHRPAGSICPMQRGVGTTCTQPNCAPGNCTSDADCTQGKNGRCLAQGPAISYQCSYDQCFADTDCAASAPCLCRSSAADPEPNVCATGSDCRVDSDCGPNGYCSPSDCGYGLGTYFCHTPADTCVDDSDCGGTTSNMRCLFDTTAKHWACGPFCPPPP
jgi:hypothetical protein